MIAPGDTIEILVDNAECANVKAGDTFKVATVMSYYIEVQGRISWRFSFVTKDTHWRKVQAP